MKGSVDSSGCSMFLAAFLAFGLPGNGARAAELASGTTPLLQPSNTPLGSAGAPAPRPLAEVLPSGQWRQVEGSVDRALAWLASRQSADGSFPTIASAQPAVTSLCVMAFLSRGHQPGHGPYGEQINRGIDFVISCQKPDGLFS